jgi:exosortase
LRQLVRFAPGIGILAVLILAYGPVLIELFRDWARDPNYYHGFLIAPVSAYLIWRRRGDLGQQAPSPSVLGLAGLLVAAALLVLGSAGAEVFTQRVSLLLLVASLVLFLHGRRRLRVVAFPLAFLLFAIPLPYVIYYGLTGPMQALAAKLAVWGLRAVGIPTVAQGNMIHLAQSSLEVAEACSGIRSLYAFLAVGALVAYSTPVPPWGRIAIFLSTIPLSVAGNAVRVWGSGMGASLIGPEATTGTVHELFGLLVFTVLLGIFLFFKNVMRKLWSSDTWSPSSSSVSRASSPAASAASDRPPDDCPTSTNSLEK